MESHEQIAAALDRLATIAEKWYAKAYPEPPEVDDAELKITRVGDVTEDEPTSLEEYRAFPEDQPGRFETLLQQVRSRS